jgi:hypothetical protein
MRKFGRQLHERPPLGRVVDDLREVTQRTGVPFE